MTEDSETTSGEEPTLTPQRGDGDAKRVPAARPPAANEEASERTLVGGQRAESSDSEADANTLRAPGAKPPSRPVPSVVPPPEHAEGAERTLVGGRRAALDAEVADENTLLSPRAEPRKSEPVAAPSAERDDGAERTLVGGDPAAASAADDANTLLAPSSKRAAPSAASAARVTKSGVPTDRGPRLETDFRPGERIGNYRLIQQVGAGGQGVVWRAFSEPLEKEVALKFLLTHLVSDPAALTVMKDEAKVLLDLTNERIVRLYNLEADEQAAYLVMEWLGGPTLSHVKDVRTGAGAGRLAPDEIVWLLEELAEALDYAHAKGVTHRDIKPANIMLTAEAGDPLGSAGERAKLTDFGIAVVTSRTAGATKPHEISGTLPYMAPEVLEGAPPSAATDIYSLGVTFYWLVKGKLPASSEFINAELRRSTKNAPPASGDEHLDAAIVAAISPDPARRPASADEFLYLASNGKRGKRALAEKGISPAKKALLVAGALAVLGSAVWVWWPRLFGAKLELLEPVNGATTHADSVEVSGRFDASTVDTVFVDFEPGDDAPQAVSVEADGTFRTTLRRPAADGTYFVRVSNEAGELRRAEVTFDTTAPKASLDLIPASVGAFAAGDMVRLEFKVDETAKLFLDDRPQDVAPGQRTIEVPAEATDSAEPVLATVDWFVEDSTGNRSAGASLSYRVFDRFARIEDVRRRQPSSVEKPNSLNVGALLTEAEKWEAEVEGDELLTSEDKAVLLAGPWSERAKELREFVAGLKTPEAVGFAPRTIEGSELKSAGKGHWLTSAASIKVSGRIDHPRDATATLTIGGVEQQVVLRSPDGAFEWPVELTAEGDLTISLGATGLAVVPSITVGRDTRPPKLELVPSESTLPAQAPIRASELVVMVARAARDAADRRRSVDLRNAPWRWVATWEEEHFAKLELIVTPPDGKPLDPIELQLDSSELWSLAVPLEVDGSWRFKLVASDQVGLEQIQTQSLVRDATPPTLTCAEPGEEIELEGRSAQRVVCSATESVTWDSLRATFTDSNDTPSQVEAKHERADETSASWVLNVPDKAGRLDLSVAAHDAAGNRSELALNRNVRASKWGALPPSMQTAATIVPESTGEAAWVEEPDGRRFPKRLRHTQSRIEFVYVKSGTFQFGGSTDEPGHQSVESPTRQVKLSGFYVARWEVSAQRYAKTDGATSERAAIPSEVEWKDARAWCREFGFELPTEAEWEYAASGPANHWWPGTNDLDITTVNAKDDSPKAVVASMSLVPVESRPKSASWCGAEQMAGNAWEWCLDNWGDDLKRVRDGELDPIHGASINTSGAHVARGGSFQQTAERLRCAFRYRSDSQYYNARGFRPVWKVE